MKCAGSVASSPKRSISSGGGETRGRQSVTVRWDRDDFGVIENASATQRHRVASEEARNALGSGRRKHQMIAARGPQTVLYLVMVEICLAERSQ